MNDIGTDLRLALQDLHALHERSERVQAEATQCEVDLTRIATRVDHIAQRVMEEHPESADAIGPLLANLRHMIAELTGSMHMAGELQ